MMRKITILLMSLALCWTTLACGSPYANQPSQGAYTRDTPQSPLGGNREFNTTSTQTPLREGQYPVQQVTYDDGNGEYTVMLLNTPPGTPATYRSTNLQMARLSDADIKAGQKSYLKVQNNQPVLYLTEDFKVEYVHNVTDTQVNPQTGQAQTVVVRRETSFWTPFLGALAGQAVGSLLFTPRYYVPPVYQPGGILRGYGGYGDTYSQAVNRYQSRYQAPPAAVRNRQAFRTTGRLQSPNYGQPGLSRSARRPYSSPSGNRSTGSGFGSSDLRRSRTSRPSRLDRPSGFGSNSRSYGGSRSFGTRSRGRR